MLQCPHCGSPADSPKCPNCGQSFEALPDPARTTPENGAETPPAADEPDKISNGERPDQPAAEESPETDGVRLSRRALLGGAGASLAVLGASGAGWWYLQDGGEGNQVVKSYVNSIAANDWARIANLYHDDAPLMKQIEEDADFDSYEGYLRQRERLERWETLDPTFRNTVEIFHITDVTRESQEKLRLGIEGSAVETIDEYRRVVAFASVSVDVLRDDQEDIAKYYDNGTEKMAFPCTVVLADGSWQLWTGRLSPL
ncbi:hypothetical protein [Halovenus halobia]|uniref:nuclear transport factor 2 family protein n=1 Tax=Halovenus halobia TaxID=3396622 RepID=UPI003F54E067